jgi:ATP-dependent protease HslVU (ClpYQ) peptidase subunit
MTTIATDGHTMAADGMTTSGGTIFGRNAVKVHQLSDGRLVGISGCAYYGPLFLEYLEGKSELPELGEDFEALVLDLDGTCKSYDHKARTLEEELPTASGSGREIALGAMAVGATPEEAVKAACERDMATGGKITVLTLPRKLRRVA